MAWLLIFMLKKEIKILYSKQTKKENFKFRFVSTSVKEGIII